MARLLGPFPAVLLGLLSVGLVIAATSCTPKETDTSTEFRRSLGEPEYLDPSLVTENEGGTVTGDTFEGLYYYGPTEKEVRPGVAMEHALSEDGRVYTFKLRPDAKWSDGKPVTAKDFEWSWLRLLDPATASRYSSIMWMIEGAEAFSKSSDEQREALRKAVGVKAVDDHTLRVTLVGPTPYFLKLTAFYSFVPVPRHVIEEHNEKWTRPENIVSNGPWVMTVRKQKDRIEAERNPHYWDAENVPFDRVVYRIFEKSEPAHNLYEAGGLDFLDSRIPETKLPGYIQNKHKELRLEEYLGVYYYMFNTKTPPFDDVRVRQALNIAVNKEKIGQSIVKGGQQPAESFVHPGLARVGYKGPAGAEFNPDRARELLAEAGYPDGKGFPTFKITYNTLEAHKAVAVYIQQQWKENLGINAEPDNMEWKVLLKKHEAKEFSVSRGAWIADFVDPMTFLELWEGSNANNHTNWDNARFNQLISDSRREPDATKRLAMLAAAEQLFLEELPAMPIYFYVNTDLVKPWVSGYVPHLQDNNLSRYFRVSERP